jgi:hypothetical protein
MGQFSPILKPRENNEFRGPAFTSLNGAVAGKRGFFTFGAK